MPMSSQIPPATGPAGDSQQAHRDSAAPPGYGSSRPGSQPASPACCAARTPGPRLATPGTGRTGGAATRPAPAGTTSALASPVTGIALAS
jgi:hypothetical protein